MEYQWPFPRFFNHNFFYVVFNCAGIRKSRVTTIAVLLLLRPFLIFLNQQFITRGARADHGSCVVTTYKTNDLHERRKEIKEKKMKRERNIQQKMLYWLSNGTFKQKHPTVKFQKESEVTYQISPQIPIFIIPSTLIKNMTPSFDGVVTAWTTEIFLMEESQPVFANWSVIDNFSCCSLSRSLTVDSVFIFSFSWILFFVFFSFLFLFLEQLGLGFISHAVTSVTNWWHSHKTDHGTWENEVKGTRIK